MFYLCWQETCLDKRDELVVKTFKNILKSNNKQNEQFGKPKRLWVDKDGDWVDKDGEFNVRVMEKIDIEIYSTENDGKSIKLLRIFKNRIQRHVAVVSKNIFTNILIYWYRCHCFRIQWSCLLYFKDGTKERDPLLTLNTRLV